MVLFQAEVLNHQTQKGHNLKELIKHKTPFVLLFFSMMSVVCGYFEFYLPIFKYLGDIIGYSILTNIFMYAIYMNKNYCTSTKVAVLGLISLNVFNIIQLYFNINLVVYDVFLILIILAILSLIEK